MKLMKMIRTYFEFDNSIFSLQLEQIFMYALIFLGSLQSGCFYFQSCVILRQEARPVAVSAALEKVRQPNSAADRALQNLPAVQI